MTSELRHAGAPAHIAIIMDGNGRWAQGRGLSRSHGHTAGAEAAIRMVTACAHRGVRHLTLYTFSTENWSRPKEEVGHLFDLLARLLTRELPVFLANNVRLRILGEWSELPFASRQVLKLVLAKTAHNTGLTLNLALNYSGRGEILRACRRLIEAGLASDDVTEDRFAQELYTAGQPDPDLIIRTSGELRLSNYLLFQAAYSEFYFTDKHWPDFDEAELDAAIASYLARQRRFGRTGEQAEPAPLAQGD
ncbi:polyprenyl diphosphate synthase [Megalodesulfovibrio gigas]|uniref:Isoprenyl transferase n=1 Tax=Megalodesulfovibrio gigas (strain ATCC 19364 / DSM 1382 / NCIMB 9332 / VKM B-1759) TaxID=1121448 RepID=T2GFN7_MEGG1|nr:polyprenyl diphosphate synthase [Megalodesulfovibrio gigas]AGW15093.1 putative Undecaprenyl pyrophosphate synthase [Megalodesulfovibrio gigas DSM 1382 = ATCC 19364]